MDANPKAVEEYIGGNEKSIQFLIGQSMRSLKGKANPQTVREVLLKLIEQMR